MRIDDNKEAAACLNNMIGSINNRVRQIYNAGYKRGYEDGRKETIDEIVSTLRGKEANNECVHTGNADAGQMQHLPFP